MGYRISTDISVSDNSKRLLRTLRSNPAEIFDRPFLGYLLFLVGGNDKNILERLHENLIYLDSVTGSDIAFAIFANNFNIQIKVDIRDEKGNRYEETQTSRAPTKIGNAELSEVISYWQIDKIIKNGKFGRVIDGDEITAISYATDEIAKQLNLLDELPCVVILDALPNPTEELKCVELTLDLASQIVTVMRDAISQLRRMENYDVLTRLVKNMSDLQQDLQAKSPEERHLEGEMARLMVLKERLERQSKLANPNRLINLSNLIDNLRQKYHALISEKSSILKVDERVRASVSEYRTLGVSFSECFEASLKSHKAGGRIQVVKGVAKSCFRGMFSASLLDNIVKILC